MKSNKAKKITYKAAEPSLTVSLNEIKKYQDFLQALTNVKTPEQKLELVKRMKAEDFNFICRCANDVRKHKGVIFRKGIKHKKHDYLTNDQGNALDNLLASKNLGKKSQRKKISNTLLKQKGGNISDYIQPLLSVLPLVLAAV